ncbi:MAG: hypothetical protein O3A46_00775 [Candidatus Poribacteria bacterium]|nr:hypothetical protein [Candidatus Poribacteria bacterium]
MRASTFDADDDGKIRWYGIGEHSTRDGLGSVRRRAVELLEKVSDPEAGTIVETAWTIPEEGEVQRHVAIIKVSGSMGEMTSDTESFFGRMELIGDPWQWSESRMDATMRTPPGRIVGSNMMSSDRLESTKTFTSDDGAFTLVFETHLAVISRGTYNVLVRYLER